MADDLLLCWVREPHSRHSWQTASGGGILGGVFGNPYGNPPKITVHMCPGIEEPMARITQTKKLTATPTELTVELLGDFLDGLQASTRVTITQDQGDRPGETGHVTLSAEDGALS